MIYETEEFVMKTLNAIVKVLTALAAVAGAVYLVAAYGDKIVAWAIMIEKCENVFFMKQRQIKFM